MTDQQPPKDVGRLYRSVATESAPTELDDTVLRRAASSAGGPRRAFFSGRWSGWIGASVAAGACALWFVGALDSPSLVNPPEQTNIVEDFAAAAADGRNRIQEIGDTASAQIPAGDPSTADLQCSSEQTATPVNWTACIDALREEGRAAAADEEMRRFFSVHGVKAPVVE